MPRQRGRRQADQFRRCPGASEEAAPDGSNVTSPEEARSPRLRPLPARHGERGPVRRLICIDRPRGAAGRRRRVRRRPGRRSQVGHRVQDRVRQRVRPDRGRRLPRGRRQCRRHQQVQGHQGGRRPPKAEVTAKITEPGFGEFRRDASCTIKPQSLIGEYYVDCQPGSPSKPRLKEAAGSRSPRPAPRSRRTWSTTSCAAPTRSGCGWSSTSSGTGLAGRPKDLQAVLKRAHPGLRETSATLRILGNQNRTIENFIRDSDTVVSQLEARKQEVSRFIEEAGETAEITATRRNELASTFNKLPGFLDELDPTMRRLGQLTDEQIPLLADVQRAAPSLDTFLTRLGPFAQASRPGDPLAGQGLREGHAGVQARQPGGGRAQAPRRPGRAHGQAAGAVPGLARRSPARDRHRLARRRSARRRPATCPTAAARTPAASPASSRSGPTSSGRASR